MVDSFVGEASPRVRAVAGDDMTGLASPQRRAVGQSCYSGIWNDMFVRVGLLMKSRLELCVHSVLSVR